MGNQQIGNGIYMDRYPLGLGVVRSAASLLVGKEYARRHGLTLYGEGHRDHAGKHAVNARIALLCGVKGDVRSRG